MECSIATSQHVRGQSRLEFWYRYSCHWPRESDPVRPVAIEHCSTTLDPSIGPTIALDSYPTLPQNVQTDLPAHPSNTVPAPCFLGSTKKWVEWK